MFSYQKMKKPQPKQDQKDKKPAEVTIEDFFTLFLEKRQKHYKNKLPKISELEKKNLEELTPEQRELVQNKHLTHEKIKYFDDIKDLYVQAFTKKDSTQQNPSSEQKQNQNANASNILNLYFAGNVLQHLPNTSQQAIQATLSLQQQHQVSDIHVAVFNAAHNHESLEQAKVKLEHFCANSELTSALETTVNSKILVRHSHSNQEQHAQQHQKVEEKQLSDPQIRTEKAPTVPAKNLFHHSSEDEEEEEVPAKQNKQTVQPAQKKAQPTEEFKIVALPEDNAEGDENWIKVAENRQGGRGKRGARGRGGRGGYKKHHEGNEEEANAENHNEAEQADNEQKDGERQEKPRGRGYGRGARGNRNPNFSGKRVEGANQEEEQNFKYTNEEGQRPPVENFNKAPRFPRNQGENREEGENARGRGYRGRGNGNYRGRGEGYRGNNDNFQKRNHPRNEGEKQSAPKDEEKQ